MGNIQEHPEQRGKKTVCDRDSDAFLFSGSQAEYHTKGKASSVLMDERKKDLEAMVFLLGTPGRQASEARKQHRLGEGDKLCPVTIPSSPTPPAKTDPQRHQKHRRIRTLKPINLSEPLQINRI